MSATALRGLIQLLGSPEFPKQLLVELQALIDVRHLSIIAFDDQLAAHMAGAESLGRLEVAKAAGKIYERSLFHRYDPNVKVIHDTESDEPLLLRLRAREITDNEYRSEIFERFKTARPADQLPLRFPVQAIYKFTAAAIGTPSTSIAKAARANSTRRTSRRSGTPRAWSRHWSPSTSRWLRRRPRGRRASLRSKCSKRW